MQLKPINQQVVAVVGASSGIGREAALRFAREGAKVVVSARNEAGLASLVGEIQTAGGEAAAISADVAHFEQVQAIADYTISEYGRLDTWVHSAANGILAPFEDITPEEFKRVIDVTLMGQVYGAKAALPYLKQTGKGALIHISSMEGRRSMPLQSAYSAAKHGLEGFLDSLRVEFKHDKVPISVTSIKPAVINTPYYNHVLTKLGVKPTGIPPYYEPSLVADAILYAAQNPIRSFIVGDVGRALDIFQKLSPELMDEILAQIGYSGQKTQEIKTEVDPNNLFAPMDGYNQAKGDFDNLVVPSLSDGLARNPALSWGAALGIGVLLAGLALKSASRTDA